MRSIAASTRFRTPSSNVRTFSLIIASSGMTFSFVPACSEPTVTTAASVGRNLAGDNRLQPEHGRSRHHDRVDAGLRHRSVSASSEHSNLQAVAGGGYDSSARAKYASGPDHHVLSEHNLGFGKTVEKAIVNHRLSALRRLLGRLKHSHQRPAPCIPSSCEQGGRADQPGDVHVMTAGVHHGHRLPVGSGSRDAARIGQPGRLLDRQRIHVRAQHDWLARRHSAASPQRPSSRLRWSLHSLRREGGPRLFARSGSPASTVRDENECLCRRSPDRAAVLRDL